MPTLPAQTDHFAHQSTDQHFSTSIDPHDIHHPISTYTHTHSIRTPNWRHPFSCVQQARDRFPVIIATVSIRNRNGLHTHNLCVASSWPSTWLSTVLQSIMLVWASIKSSRGAASHCSTLTPLTAEFFFFSFTDVGFFVTMVSSDFVFCMWELCVGIEYRSGLSMVGFFCITFKNSGVYKYFVIFYIKNRLVGDIHLKKSLLN